MIIKYFVEIQNSFIHKFSSIKKMIQTLLILCEKMMNYYFSNKIRNDIFTHSMRILEFLISGKISKVSEENVLLIKKILNKAVPEHFRSILPFIAVLISDLNNKNIFDTLNDYDVRVEDTKQNAFETILTNDPKLIETLYDLAKENLTILEEAWKIDTEIQFANYIKQNLKNKRLQRAGMWIREIENELNDSHHRLINRLRQIYRHFKLEEKFNMLNYLLEISVLNEALFVFYTLLYGKRRIFIKSIFHNKNFTEEFLNPFFELIFNDQIDFYLQNYVLILFLLLG